MLTFLLGTDWKANRNAVLDRIAADVSQERGGRILIVPESISHDTERRLCQKAGDTASRYAEVLSFSRMVNRVRDAAQQGTYACLDAGGRLVAMAAAAMQLHSKLKAYAAVETKPEFLRNLVDAVDEFKRCCISPEDLMAASKLTQGSLAQKLEELSLLLEAYDAICARGKRDPADQMSWLLEQLEDCDFASQHVFYIDGFPDFTQQHLQILMHIISNAQNVYISLNCDEIDTQNPAFEKAGSTALTLLRYAQQNGIPAQVQYVKSEDTCLQVVRQSLFRGNVNSFDNVKEVLRVYQCDSVAQECAATALQILQYVKDGGRYRDMSVVCADLHTYRNELRSVFSRCGIPLYLSGTEDILDYPVLNTVLGALEAALNGLEQKDVLRYLKSALSPLDTETCDQLENYALLWNITGNRWKETFTNHPEGLGGILDDQTQQFLQQLSNAKDTALTPLLRLQSALQRSVNLGEQIHALYDFLEEISLPQRLTQLSEQMEHEGENAAAQALNQLWEILLNALEQLHDMLDETVWDTEAFARLLRLLLSQYTVGTIPPVLDSVTAGAVSTMANHQAKHLFFLGLHEGVVPGYGGIGGVLTEQERLQIRKIGVRLTGGALDGLQIEFSEIYSVFCSATNTVSASCSAGQPSFIYRRLVTLAGGEQSVDTHLVAALVNPKEAAAYLVQKDILPQQVDMALQDSYGIIFQKAKHVLGDVCRESIEKLYGNILNLSASQVDKLADCRLSYFLRYGLRAKERLSATIDPAEFGTYVHAVLEQTAKEVVALGGFRKVSMEKTLEIATKYSEEYALERFSQIDSKRLAYLFRRNTQELKLVVEELWNELQSSDFEPVGFEVNFGTNGQLPPIPISGHAMQAQLRGFIDRVDVWKAEEANYYRVVDYKTGRKDFDYCDVFNGLGLQMLLYLFALEDGNLEMLGGNPVPAGIQYFPARVPLVSLDSVHSEEEVRNARTKEWKRKGLILNDSRVIHAMENSDQMSRLCCTQKKDGTLSGDIADTRQLKLLKTYVFSLLGRMVDDIASGCITPNPYTRGNSHNACTFCPYSMICHPDTAENRRDYKSMTSQRFWDEVEKEVSKLG